jgi:hypothetical protein
VVLEWDDVAGATEYSVLVSQNSDMSDPVIEDHTAAESDTLSGFSNGQTFYWQVFAVNSDGDISIGSQIWSFTQPENTVVTGKVPDTGQTNSYTKNTPGKMPRINSSPSSTSAADSEGTLIGACPRSMSWPP